MNKTPISIALERQIPEFIREDYDLFVKFIKAYYAFLEETQQRNLEDIRSVENTLDEFVIKFKKELATVFPTNALENERFILQRMQEFYMTRGSIESFQFLFRSIFNRDATIYYPSQQILRASDGKWTQETSVFVKQTAGDIDALSGKIIKIVTDKKHIDVFCTKVLYYRDDVYEVFIDRRYIADIDINDEVKLNSNTGSIIPCPAKYTIVEEGKGFTVGSIYNLPSEKGNGSTIKITKVGTNGEIKKIQIISFGLDYESNFYAKLSNKTPQAIPYYHPIRADDVNKLLNPYEEQGLGYIDYGYINTQDYFYYDTNYQFVDSNNQYFYADGSYVGEIIGSFYTNATGNVIDEDTAEIRIDLGPVAVYPGFYQKSDGFISDEIYIQDGKYYQLFSYVIKVEEQLDKYKDIVLSLLHPAGLELFAEYTIRNDFVLSVTPLLAFIRRQFLDSEFTADSVYQDNYKAIQDTFALILNNVIDINQSISDEVNYVDYQYNDISKLVDSNDSSVFTESTYTSFSELVKLDDQNISEVLVSTYNATKTDNSNTIDYQWDDFSSTKEDAVESSFIRINSVEPVKSEIIDVPDDETGVFTLPKSDTIDELVDSNIATYGLNKTDNTIAPDEYVSTFTLSKTETPSLLDINSINTTLETRQETISIDDDLLEFGLSGATWTDSQTPVHSSLILQLSGTTWADSQTPVHSSLILQLSGTTWSDVYTATESYTSQTSYFRTNDDVVQTNDDLLSFNLSGASWSDTPTSIDQFSRISDYFRTFNDTSSTLDDYKHFSLSGTSWTDASYQLDNVNRITSYNRDFADNVTLTQNESFNRIVDFKRSFNDNVFPYDQLAFGYLFDEGPNLLDVFSSITLYSRAFNDTSIASHITTNNLYKAISNEQVNALSQIQSSLLKYIADESNQNDQLAITFNSTTKNDLVSIGENGLQFTLSGNSWLDTSTTTDSFTTLTNYSRNANDLFATSDSTTNTFNKLLTDQSNQSDTLNRIVSYSRTLSDTQQQTELLSYSLQFTTIGDAQSIGDFTALTPTKNISDFISQPIDDLLSFGLSGTSWQDKTNVPSDAYASTINYVRSFNDIALVSDFAAFGLLYSDQIASTLDSFNLGVSYVRSISDAISLSESGLSFNILGSTFSDTSQVADDILSFNIAGTTFADTYTITQGNHLFALSGNTFKESINNITNTGLLYANPYNQDDESNFFTYFLESYAVIDSRALT